jgi:hypothetical protein
VDSTEYNIRRHALDSLNLSVTYTADDGVTPINLTGYTVTFNVYDRRGGSVIATLTSGSGVTVTAAAGQIQVDRTPAQITAWKLSNGKGAYDLSISSSTGTTNRLLLKGTLEIVRT